ncbi:MAG: hypothetical protein FI707_07285 [SAR202 cluster bacterium]|jgi:hypothetical protein|nr:hypothetical protein [Chloroflexota bacterium]MDP6421998.1 PCP reductase family protein [SAR202 cluster bacterium]HAL47937.1 hypothetical protein [Dehalococcoidia bacterium]MDP6664901.1 PCP reductase family protein [SAR202 cluster bacterium]MDP6799823.1 PCP reductase family protein [SAR202 cluster bacterium]|tara:strand:- start:3855 stop:4247 length:393 start_codon:yes stop_codon:yes gene_type:complete
MGTKGDQFSDVEWTSDALERLQRVPVGMARDMTRQRVEALAVEQGKSSVTPDMIEAKYHQWGEGSAKASSELVWTDAASERVQRIPKFVRGMVVKAVEEYAHREGQTEITPEMLDEAKGFWGDTGRFHNP